MKPHITIVTLGVVDLKKSTHFYRDILGWKTSSSSNENISFFTLKNITLGLYPIDKLEADVDIPVTISKHASITMAHNLGSKKAVIKLFLELRAKGVEIIKEPQDVFWGGYSGYFSDPDGYLWEVAWNPSKD